MKQVTAETQEDVSMGKMKGAEKKIEDLQPRYSGLAFAFLTRSWIPGATPTRWTGNNE
jgi:hypothetical protein